MLLGEGQCSKGRQILPVPAAPLLRAQHKGSSTLPLQPALEPRDKSYQVWGTMQAFGHRMTPTFGPGGRTKDASSFDHHIAEPWAALQPTTLGSATAPVTLAGLPQQESSDIYLVRFPVAPAGRAVPRLVVRGPQLQGSEAVLPQKPPRPGIAAWGTGLCR